MSDPKYLSDEDSEASDFERELVRAAQGVRLSAPEKQAIWAGVALQAVPLAAPPSAAPTALGTKSALTLTPLVKGVLLAAGLGGLSLAGYALTRAPTRQAPNESRTAPSPAPQASAELPDVPTPPSSAQRSAPPSTSGKATNSPAVNREPSPSDAKSALSDESAAVLEIRRTLRAGDANGALRLLAQARTRFAKGALGQEREALTIEALAKSGARAAAARKAQAFLRTFPQSPYASDVRGFVAE